MGRKLIALNFKASAELPQLDELTSFLATDLGRQLPGFTTLDTDVAWGDVLLDLVGRDGDGRIVAVLPMVSPKARAFHEVIARALVASTWMEDNREELTRRYGDRGVNLEEALRLILVAPALAAPSHTLARALARAGVEILPYAIYEIDTGDGCAFAVSFEAAPARAASGSAAPPAPARDTERRRRETEVPPAGPHAPDPGATASAAAASRAAEDVVAPAPAAAEPAPPPRPPSPVQMFIASLTDTNVKAMSEQIVTFLLTRFPEADGVVSQQDRGFTLSVGAAHLATIRLDRSALWLEVGPERIPTNKIKDPATLERAMNLPSVLDALGSVHSP
jgi:hypothetical protein